MKKFLLISLLLIAGATKAENLKQGVLSNVTKLTTGTDRFENPKWSPDGSKIAYTNYGYNNLYVMNANGANKKCISTAEGVGFGYEWSNNSEQIFAADVRYTIESGRKVRKQALWSISIDGKSERLTEDVTRLNQVTKLSSKKYKSTRSSSSLQTVSFSCEPQGLYVVNQFGKKTLINEGPSFCPALSPDGKKVVFNHGNNVCVMNIDGTGKKVLDRGFNPVWANNSQIVYEQSKDDGHTYISSDLYIIGVNGVNKKALTKTSDKMEMCPAISPDGSKIVFTSFSDGQVYSADLK